MTNQRIPEHCMAAKKNPRKRGDVKHQKGEKFVNRPGAPDGPGDRGKTSHLLHTGKHAGILCQGGEGLAKIS